MTFCKRILSVFKTEQMMVEKNRHRYRFKFRAF
jgi:hypothetical protein